MAVLEQVMRLKEQGIPETQIINELSQQGVSPKEISEALRQAQIKFAVSDSNPGGEEEMMPSIMSEEGTQDQNAYSGQTYTPQGYEQQEQYQQYPQQEAPQELYMPQGYPTQQQEQYVPAPEYTPSQEQYPQEQFYQPGGYEQYAPAAVDTSTVMEVADQVFSERIKKIQKQSENFTEAASLLQAKTENISERLKKIEMIIDKLQIAILEKIGSYGGNLESIKKEMSMMQDSFSKMLSPSRRREPPSNESGEKKAPKK